MDNELFFTITQTEYDELKESASKTKKLISEMAKCYDKNTKLKQALLESNFIKQNVDGISEDKSLDINSCFYALDNVDMLLRLIGYEEMQNFIQSKIKGE